MSSAELPMGMRRVLRNVAGRRWALRWIELQALVIAGTAATILVWLFFDAFWNLSPVVRAIGQVAAVVVFALLIGRGLRRLFFDPLSDAQLARMIDLRYPELQERFTTCCDLLQQPAPTTRMGRWFRNQLKRETFPQLRAIDPEKVMVDTRPLWVVLFLFVVFILAILPRTWWGSGYAHLWSRWERPWDNHGWGRLSSLSISPRDGFAMRDRDFLITATLTHYRAEDESTPSLTLHWRTDGDRVWQTRPLQAHEFGHYSGVIPHVPRDVEWYVTGPAVESPRTVTRVMDAPQIAAVTATIDPPGYTRQASRQMGVMGDLAVLAGSRVRLSLLFDQPLREAELSWPSGDGVITSAITLTHRGTQGSVDVVATNSGPFGFRMTTPQGLTIDDPPRSLSVRPDQPPVVKLHGPMSLSLRPDDRHDIAAQGNDDFGLTRTELHAEVGGKAMEPIPLTLPNATTTSAELAHTIDLLPWNLAAGTSVLLRIRVLDNREQPGPQEGWSTPRVIVISTSAISEAERRLADNTRQSRNELGEIIKQLEEERTQLRDIHQKTAAATVRQKQAEQEQRLKEIAEAHQELQERIQDFAAMLSDDEPGEALRQQTEQVVNGPLASAAKKFEATPKLEPRDQIPTLSQALDDLAAARKALQKIDDALIARNALGDDLQTLRQLANRSDRLAEEVRDDNETTSQEASAAVQKIRDELTQVVKRRPEWQTAMIQAEQNERAEQAARQQAEMNAKATAEQPASALNPENVPSQNTEKPMATETGSPMPNQNTTASNDKMTHTPSATGPVPTDAGAELSQAQQQLRDAQSKLSSMMGAGISTDADGPAERSLTTSNERASTKGETGLSRTLTPAPANGSPAAVALQKAAKALRAAIEKTAGPAAQSEQGSPSSQQAEMGRGQSSAGQPGETGAAGEEAIVSEFAGRGSKSASHRNWGRLPTGLRTEILQGSKRPAHSDYARQVQRYFERIAQPTPSAESENKP